MTGPHVSSQHVPERLAMAALSGLLAWWFSRTAVHFLWAVVPFAALTLGVISHHIWVTWLTWGLAMTGLTASLVVTLGSSRSEMALHQWR